MSPRLSFLVVEEPLEAVLARLDVGVDMVPMGLSSLLRQDDCSRDLCQSPT